MMAITVIILGRTRSNRDLVMRDHAFGRHIRVYLADRPVESLAEGTCIDSP